MKNNCFDGATIFLVHYPQNGLDAYILSLTLKIKAILKTFFKQNSVLMVDVLFIHLFFSKTKSSKFLINK